jgi:hypothetical protein
MSSRLLLTRHAHFNHGRARQTRANAFGILPGIFIPFEVDFAAKSELSKALARVQLISRKPLSASLHAY